ncbi:hypothetical protein A2130_01445 [Candidatus Woesebacteria bacterium GWC2_33_12]|uniref:Uncharacterized protein n=1 Tax=Candidatus Woesebacteria bacterium GW2011_GWB1_33_22 TaxID=1618566 RepID=A0A0G0A108_9BACT|nr:MAG: hypothetical protein UR29_C0007G0006 [Candidatus Woesebacteria bacterium GW2011_GWC2_33_12]KKP42142.1 MAG: hypothetical protein UR33_C0005G0006 [Candidatus Woesebacteria bacterium GW2011_GWA2_33_20]KKP44876.1 MAG: hypothetical protein UR35_C0005G0006 [Candidatus Woesebacteria bacterium GW2011_GWB1_33_22]KKP46690.1 MAG: hypothetical protein UR37_C0005G0006 [Microgenomates group bacterium GW2011_GWC1_33_28]KKP50590.1 MAG: hypothetical protein UR41_C0005G0006 [Candidatus Woesebacteria bact
MTKKRTRKQKEHAQITRVNSQLGYKFNESYNFEAKNEMANLSARKEDLGSVKKELYKSLGIAILILISLMVLYWFS